MFLEIKNTEEVLNKITRDCVTSGVKLIAFFREKTKYWRCIYKIFHCCYIIMQGSKFVFVLLMPKKT